MNSDQIKRAFENFNDLRVLVIGDLMIDSYMVGRVNRISPEAPVPVVHVTSTDNRLGGAANVGLNLVALGAQTFMAGVIGSDGAGGDMINLLQKSGINHSAVIQSSNRTTTRKTRVISHSQQVVRVDEEELHDISEEEENKLLLAVETLMDSGLDAIIFEDYNKGVLTERLISEVIKKAKARGIHTCVDPKLHNFLNYKSVSLFKPNLKEIKEGLKRHVDPSEIKSIRAAAEELESYLQNDLTLITLSEHGVYVKSNGQEHHHKAHIRNIADVSGAGDTVISVAACCLAAGLKPEFIAGISNLAGGLVCEELGVVPIDKEKLLVESVKIFGK